MKIDRLELVRLLVRIVETGSLSAAGRSLGLSQPSTSRQLAALEALLGVQLVRRSTHELTLTEAGERFLTAAGDLLAGWEAAVEDARAERSDLRGRIRIASPVALGQTIVAGIAARFLLRHPAVTIDLRLIDEPGDLAAGGYDLWLRAGPIHDQSLIVRDLWRIERTIVARAPSHPVGDPTDLAERSAVRLATYVADHVVLDARDGRRATLRMRPAFTTDNIYAALVAVRAGVGYGVLPYWAVQDDLLSGVMTELCPNWHPPTVTLSVAYPKLKFRPLRVNTFIKFISTELPRGDAGIYMQAQPRAAQPAMD